MYAVDFFDGAWYYYVMTDLHLHTRYSFDGKESPKSYIATAVGQGDKFIGFADHCEYNMREFDADFPTPDFDAYFSELHALSEKFGYIAVLKGVELGYSDRAVEAYKKLLKKFPFDYSILSVHTVGDRGDCYYPAYFKGADKRTAYALYLEETLKAVRSDVEFQVLGHLGYVARYAPYDEKDLVYADFADIIDKILHAIIDRGAALELNTSATGLRSDVVTHGSIIARYAELGGRSFAFGSDAHAVSRYAYGKDKAKTLLASLGVRHTVRFENRLPVKENF